MKTTPIIKATSDTAKNSFDYVIGLTETEAMEALDKHGYTSFVEERDGEQFFFTYDFNEKRIRLCVKENRVFKFAVG